MYKTFILLVCFGTDNAELKAKTTCKDGVGLSATELGKIVKLKEYLDWNFLYH